MTPEQWQDWARVEPRVSRVVFVELRRSYGYARGTARRTKHYLHDELLDYCRDLFPRERDKWRGECSLETWCERTYPLIVKQRIRDLRERHKAGDDTKRVADWSRYSTKVLHHKHATPEDCPIAFNDADELITAAGVGAGLDARQIQIVRLRLLYKMTFAEIAERVGINDSSTHDVYTCAVRELGRELERRVTASVFLDNLYRS